MWTHIFPFSKLYVFICSKNIFKKSITGKNIEYIDCYTPTNVKYLKNLHKQKN